MKGRVGTKEVDNLPRQPVSIRTAGDMKILKSYESENPLVFIHSHKLLLKRLLSFEFTKSVRTPSIPHTLYLPLKSSSYCTRCRAFVVTLRS